MNTSGWNSFSIKWRMYKDEHECMEFDPSCKFCLKSSTHIKNALEPLLNLRVPFQRESVKGEDENGEYLDIVDTTMFWNNGSKGASAARDYLLSLDWE